MPQVASDLGIRSVRPEPLGRPAAADEPSGTFGEMLEASAGSGVARPDGAKSARQSDSADPAKPGNEGAPVPAAANAEATNSASGQVKPTGAPANDAQSTGENARNAVAPVVAPMVMTVDLAIFAQAADAEPLPCPSSDKAGTTDTVVPAADTTASDKGADAGAADGGDSATALVVTPDAQMIATPATIVAVAVPTAAPADSQPIAASADSAAGSASLPPVTSPVPAPAGIDTAPAQGPAQAAAVASADPGETDAASAEREPTLKAAAPVSADVETAPAEAATAFDVPTEPDAAKAAGLPAQPETKPHPRAGQETQSVKADGSKTSTDKPEAGKAKDSLHADANPAQPPAAADETHAAGHAADQDVKTPAAHQPHGESSDQASATPRRAFAAAHSDVLAPAAVPPAATASVSRNPAAFGLNLATPLAYPLQSVWQAASQRADSSDNAVPIAGLPVEIVSRAQDGLRRFEIRLDPPELGRIDVRLDVDRGGNVTSRLTVERAETLDLLRRDAPQLERALQHAGLNTEGGLQFSLRDQNFANREQTPHHASTLIVPDDEPAAAEAARRGYGRLIGLGGGIDIRV